MTTSADEFLAGLRLRLEAGAREYGDRSFTRSVSSLVQEIREEMIDEVGWIYILWAVACRKAIGPTAEQMLRAQFLQALRQRIARNDRGRNDEGPLNGLYACLTDLEVLALDCVLHLQAIETRLLPIARAIEVAQAIKPTTALRGRLGGMRGERFDD